MNGRPGRPGTPKSGPSRQSGGYSSSGGNRPGGGGQTPGGGYRPGGGYTPGGGYRPGGPRRPGGSGSNDNVMPLITGVLGSSILAFSLYVFSQNPGLLGDIIHAADDDGPNFPSVSDQSYCQPAPAVCESCHRVHPYQPAAAASEQPDEACQPDVVSYQPPGEAYEPANKAKPAPQAPKISIEKKKWLTEREEEILKDRRQKEKQCRGKLQKELSEHLRKVQEIRDELHKEKKQRKYPWD